MRTIWKFPVQIRDSFTIDMPRGSDLLCVQTQRGEPQLWALCDPAAPAEVRRFLLAGTGRPRPDLAGARYVGSFQMHDGDLVFHLFEANP